MGIIQQVGNGGARKVALYGVNPTPIGFQDDFIGPSPASWWTTLLGTLATNSGALRASAIASGGEMIPNNDFLNWVGDNPTDWTVVGEVGVDPMVTQAGPSLARWFTSAGVSIYAYPTVPRVVSGATYAYSVVVTAVAAGTGALTQLGTDQFCTWNAPGTVAGTKTLTLGTGLKGASVQRNSAGVANDFTLDSVSLKLVSAAIYVNLGTPNATVTASMISPAALVTPRAILLRMTDELNFVRLLLLPNTAGVDTYLETMTAGVRADVQSADVDWTPGGVDQVRVTVSGNNYTVQHMKAGTSTWTTAFTAVSASFNTITNFGLQVFAAADNSFDAVNIRPVV